MGATREKGRLMTLMGGPLEGMVFILKRETQVREESHIYNTLICIPIYTALCQKQPLIFARAAFLIVLVPYTHN